MKRFLFYLIAIIGLSFTSCKDSKDLAEEALAKIPSAAEIGTVEYVITKLIKANDNTAFYKFGDRKIVFSCRATMKAGVDMQTFTANDVVFTDTDVTITLPQPKVLAFNINPEDIRMEYCKVSGMRSGFTAEERLDLLQQGEKAILDDAENLGILNDAKTNAVEFFKMLLAHCGFENVNVCFKEGGK